MGKSRADAGKAIRWLGAGAALGGCFAAGDGCVLGMLVGGPWTVWTGGFALAGAAVGGALGLFAALLGPRMVLRPPGEDEER